MIFLRGFDRFTGEHLYQEFKQGCSYLSYCFNEGSTVARVFSFELGVSFGSNFFVKHLKVTAFLLSKDWCNICSFLQDSLKKGFRIRWYSILAPIIKGDLNEF